MHSISSEISVLYPAVRINKGLFGSTHLSLYQYKLQAVHALSNRDKEMRLLFCRQFMGILTENPVLPYKLLMRDEAHFHLHGTVNKGLFGK
jgi:hypothetical protein